MYVMCSRGLRFRAPEWQERPQGAAPSPARTAGLNSLERLSLAPVATHNLLKLGSAHLVGWLPVCPYHLSSLWQGQFLGGQGP